MTNYIGEVLDELYRYHEIFNNKFFEGKLGKVIITLQKAKRNNLGHFTLAKVWCGKTEEEESFYEININNFQLHRPAEDIVGTILHEQIHQYHRENDIQDAPQNKHNKRFKRYAESLGFIVTHSKTYGWGHTELGDELKEYILNEIKPNEDVFKYARIIPLTDAEKPKKERIKKTFKYICPICGMEAKGKKDIVLKCGICDDLMLSENEDD